MNAVFQPAPDDTSKQEQIQHLPGGGNGMFPKGQLQPKSDRGQDDRPPGIRHRQQGVFVLDEEPLPFQPVMRQQRRRACQSRQRQRCADGGKIDYSLTAWATNTKLH